MCPQGMGLERRGVDRIGQERTGLAFFKPWEMSDE
jgi:hypothetical protein